MVGANIEDTVRLDKITGEPTGVPGILTECAKVIKRFRMLPSRFHVLCVLLFSQSVAEANGKRSGVREAIRW